MLQTKLDKMKTFKEVKMTIGADLPVCVEEAACLVCDRMTAAASLKSVEERSLQCAHKLQEHPQHSWSISTACK